jgi:predicted ATPase with chaperone activity
MAVLQGSVRGSLSQNNGMQRVVRNLKVSRTIADLAGDDELSPKHFSGAEQQPQRLNVANIA